MEENKTAVAELNKILIIIPVVIIDGSETQLGCHTDIL